MKPGGPYGRSFMKGGHSGGTPVWVGGRGQRNTPHPSAFGRVSQYILDRQNTHNMPSGPTMGRLPQYMGFQRPHYSMGNMGRYNDMAYNMSRYFNTPYSPFGGGFNRQGFNPFATRFNNWGNKQFSWNRPTPNIGSVGWAPRNRMIM